MAEIAYSTTFRAEPLPPEVSILAEEVPVDIIKRLKNAQEVLMTNAILGEHSPYYFPLELPEIKFEARGLRSYELFGFGVPIIDPRKVACVVHAGMALPDARPVRLSLEQMLSLSLTIILRRQGYRVYARAKRVRREVRRGVQ